MFQWFYGVNGYHELPLISCPRFQLKANLTPTIASKGLLYPLDHNTLTLKYGFTT